MLKSIFEFAVNILKCDKYTSTENKSCFEEEKIGSQLLVGCRTLFNTCCHTIDAQLLMESESCTRKYKHNDNSQFHIMTCQILYFTYRLDIGTVHCTLYQAVRFLQQIKSNTFTTESIRSKVNTVVGGEANRVSQRAHNATSGTFYVSMCEIYYSMSSAYILYLESTLFGYYLLFRVAQSAVAQ